MKTWPAMWLWKLPSNHVPRSFFLDDNTSGCRSLFLLLVEYEAAVVYIDTLGQSLYSCLDQTLDMLIYPDYPTSIHLNIPEEPVNFSQIHNISPGHLSSHQIYPWLCIKSQSSLVEASRYGTVFARKMRLALFPFQMPR